MPLFKPHSKLIGLVYTECLYKMYQFRNNVSQNLFKPLVLELNYCVICKRQDFKREMHNKMH